MKRISIIVMFWQKTISVLVPEKLATEQVLKYCYWKIVTVLQNCETADNILKHQK